MTARMKVGNRRSVGMGKKDKKSGRVNCNT